MKPSVQKKRTSFFQLVSSSSSSLGMFKRMESNTAIHFVRLSKFNILGLVMTNIANWKDPPFFMGKSTISTGPFSIAMPFFMGKSTISMAIFNSYLWNYQRVVNWKNHQFLMAKLSRSKWTIQIHHRHAL